MIPDLLHPKIGLSKERSPSEIAPNRTRSMASC